MICQKLPFPIVWPLIQLLVVDHLPSIAYRKIILISLI
ncbi:hypothetical protein BVRB_8g193800 [Beta vulgaris subsp. vulgaris]|nr:hypothetical protein BVRB_8g193800 [Beta vulgaris subsp. vulgaris]